MRRDLLACSLIAIAACGPRPDSSRASDSGRNVVGSTPAPDSKDSTFQLDARCPGETNTFECARVIERSILAHDTVHARRSGDSLVLALANKRVRVLADSGEEAESVHFSYRGYLPTLGVHVVHEQYYEGSAFNLVSTRTGRSQFVPEEPVLSPDGRRLASAISAAGEDYALNKLLVLRGAGDTLVLELDLEPKTFGFDRPRWVDDSTIDVMRVTPKEDSPDGTRTPARARYRAGKWRVDTIPPRT
jgi:hypothetical protein